MIQRSKTLQRGNCVFLVSCVITHSPEHIEINKTDTVVYLYSIISSASIQAGIHFNKILHVVKNLYSIFFGKENNVLLKNLYTCILSRSEFCD